MVSELSALIVYPYILFLKFGVDRQDDIGKQTIILHPGVLGQYEFYLRASKRFYETIAIIPAGYPARRIGPYHVYFRAALDGIGVFLELVFTLASQHNVVPYQLIGGLRMASWTRSLGIICFGTLQ